MRTIVTIAVERPGPAVLMLHGTYWSKVWQPVIGQMVSVRLGL